MEACLTVHWHLVSLQRDSPDGRPPKEARGNPEKQSQLGDEVILGLGHLASVPSVSVTGSRHLQWILNSFSTGKPPMEAVEACTSDPPPRIWGCESCAC
jgi:hypothetical protein